jgi:hypothetical protein
MDDRNPGRGQRLRWLALVLAGLLLGAAPAVGAAPSGATVASTRSGTSGASTSPAATANANLTLDQWKQRYEHDIGILADDVLVVVDDGKRAQKHDTTAKVKTTLQDCRQWAKDAAIAPTAAPPIPLPAAQRAWKNMMRASALAAAQCVAALQKRSLTSARNFRKQLAVVEKNEATLVKLLNG